MMKIIQIIIIGRTMMMKIIQILIGRGTMMKNIQIIIGRGTMMEITITIFSHMFLHGFDPIMPSL